jgi:hypothetical protein
MHIHALINTAWNEAATKPATVRQKQSQEQMNITFLLSVGIYLLIIKRKL